jgi:hypothetical protein
VCANIKVVRVTLAFFDWFKIATKTNASQFYFRGAKPCCGNLKSRIYRGKENNLKLLVTEFDGLFLLAVK